MGLFLITETGVTVFLASLRQANGKKVGFFPAATFAYFNSRPVEQEMTLNLVVFSVKTLNS